MKFYDVNAKNIYIYIYKFALPDLCGIFKFNGIRQKRETDCECGNIFTSDDVKSIVDDTISLSYFDRQIIIDCNTRSRRSSYDCLFFTIEYIIKYSKNIVRENYRMHWGDRKIAMYY